ncbi:MAG TPA: amino acid racemase [Candidatus Dormibacteraeota bacterium]|jgi:aspartate racemase|nr:amino acid racemase [Candidatus Dormibacteraeota bacterium]
MTKHIGIVGCSAEGAALCYRTICLEAEPLMGRHAHPEVTLHTISLAEYMKPIDAGAGWQPVAELMLRSAEALKRAGADFLICPDNTIHEALPFVVPRSPLPWLHIAEEVGKEAQRRGFKKLGITGTKFLVSGPVYPEKLEQMGIGYMLPNVAQRERINTIIFDELVRGRQTAEALTYLQQVIEDLKNQGCDAVVLGCTELPLLISDRESPLPALDSTRTLARAALRHALAG